MPQGRVRRPGRLEWGASAPVPGTETRSRASPRSTTRLARYPGPRPTSAEGGGVSKGTAVSQRNRPPSRAHRFENAKDPLIADVEHEYRKARPHSLHQVQAGASSADEVPLEVLSERLIAAIAAREESFRRAEAAGTPGSRPQQEALAELPTPGKGLTCRGRRCLRAARRCRTRPPSPPAVLSPARASSFGRRCALSPTVFAYSSPRGLLDSRLPCACASRLQPQTRPRITASRLRADASWWLPADNSCLAAKPARLPANPNAGNCQHAPPAAGTDIHISVDYRSA